MGGIEKPNGQDRRDCSRRMIDHVTTMSLSKGFRALPTYTSQNVCDFCSILKISSAVKKI